METFEFTVIGEYLSNNEITADHHALERECEADAMKEAIHDESRERSADWQPVCVTRGHIQLCWAKDQ